MSQVSLLSVDVGQGPDTHSAKGDASNKSQANTRAFSEAMEQHYPTKKVRDATGKDQQNGNVASKAATAHHQTIINGDDKKQTKLTKADDAHILPVPLPIDDEPLSAEQADNDAPMASRFLPVDGESIIAKLNVNDNADTLPVPLPIDDESLTSNVTVSDNNATVMATGSSDNKQQLYITNPKDKAFSPPVTTPAPLSPLEIEIRAIEKAGGIFNGDPKDPGKQQTLYTSFQTQTQTPQVSNSNANNTVNDDAVDLLKMLNGAQQLLTKQGAENTATTQDTKLAQVNSSLNASDIAKIKPLEAGKEAAQLSKEATQLSQDAAINVAGAQTKNTADLALANEVIKAAETAAKPTVNNANTPSAEALAKNIADNVTETKLTPEAKAIAIAQGVIVSEANEQDSVDESHGVRQEADRKKSQASVENNSNVANKVSDEITASKVKESDAAIVNAAHSAQLNAEVKRANDNEHAQTRAVNQSTASVTATPTLEPKAEVNQKTATADEQSKLAISADDAKPLGKHEAEKQAQQPEKIVSAFNQTLAAQAASPALSAGELAARQEQSFESAINTLTTNTVQTQKSITAMNTETIAIYRKDFADAVKDKVMVMINQKIQQVEIQLDPPEMGNIHVRVNLQSEQAAVQFVVQNQQAKDALEQNMGKLRDMLAESGVDVGDASIEQRQAKEQNGNDFDGQANNGESAESGEGASNENDNSVLNVVKASSTGVDYYA